MSASNLQARTPGRTMLRSAAVCLLALATAAAANGQGSDIDADAVHKRMLTIDAHLDTPMHFPRHGWHFDHRHDLNNDIVQVDLPRMLDGNLDGGFFVIYTAQGPLDEAGYRAANSFALQRAEEIRETIRNSNGLVLALQARDARLIADSGEAFGFLSMENSYPLGEDLGQLELFHDLGVRLAGPVHSSNNQFSDSATDTPRWNGLSPLGQRWVQEMNRLGIVIDASHASDAAFDQLLALSKTPILLSHSGSREVFDHPRNLNDDRIRKLAAAGGVICATSVYLAPMNFSERRGDLFARMDRIGSLSPEEQAVLIKDAIELDREEPLQSADFETYMNGLLHLIETAGVDHVCFGADWDGGGGVDGLRDITDQPRITARLLEAGFSEDEIEKMWSGNILRLLQQAEEYSSKQSRK